MSEQVRRQVERIIDEGTGRLRNVIIQMRTEDEVSEEVLRRASEAARRRSLTTTARDVIPPAAELLRKAKSGDVTRTTREHLREARTSLASQVALTMPGRVTRSQLTKQGNRTLRPLLTSEVFQGSVRKMLNRKRTMEDLDPESLVHWASGSATIEMTVDDLARVHDAVEGVTGVYRNRTLRVPPVVEVKRLPRNVSDNKASAWGVEAIGALAAWGAYENGANRSSRGGGVKVGVLDTGADPSHPDLSGKVSAFAEFDQWSRRVAGAEPRDTERHGTHVAGIVAGGNASGRWIGVAPEAELVVGAVLPSGAGTDAQVLAGMQWAIEEGVDVLNMSLGGLLMAPDVPDTYTRTILSAVRLGIPVVTAIGNEGSQTSGSPGNDALAFAVGATDPEDRSAGFSGGRTQIITDSRFFADEDLPLVYSKPDVSAPGMAISSAVPGGGWEAWNGTSMAAPHVAGAVALLLGACPAIRQVESTQRAFLLQDLLAASVEELGEAGQDHRYGLGRIDVLRAIGFAREKGY